jgi:glycosyltransferase involved in cell wall biosynthesis
MLEERARARWGLEGKLSVIPINLARDVRLLSDSQRRELRQTARERIAASCRAENVSILLWVARMVPDKGADRLLAALSSMDLPARKGLILLFCGDGIERPRLEKMAEAMGLSASVRFLGFVAYEELPAYLAAADVLVIPSLHDAGPMVAIEAATTGTPVILTDGCGYADLFAQADAGLIVPAGSTVELADAIQTLLRDPERRAVLAANAARLVKTMELETVARSMIELFERVRRRPRE